MVLEISAVCSVVIRREHRFGAIRGSCAHNYQKPVPKTAILRGRAVRFFGRSALSSQPARKSEVLRPKTLCKTKNDDALFTQVNTDQINFIVFGRKFHFRPLETNSNFFEKNQQRQIATQNKDQRNDWRFLRVLYPALSCGHRPSFSFHIWLAFAILIHRRTARRSGPQIIERPVSNLWCWELDLRLEMM